MQVSDFTPAQADALLPARAPETSKNDYGRVWAFCGSRGYTGAAYFAAQAAVRMGSGIVTLAVPDCIYPILAVKLNEPVIRPYTRADWRKALAGASRAAASRSRAAAVSLPSRLHSAMLPPLLRLPSAAGFLFIIPYSAKNRKRRSSKIRPFPVSVGFAQLYARNFSPQPIFLSESCIVFFITTIYNLYANFPP